MTGARRTLALGSLLLLVALAGCSFSVVEKPVCHTRERGAEGPKRPT
jgi:peptidoglycan/LPS O-acetylase OafA/YrhL